MGDLAGLVGYLEAEPRSILSQLEWEQLPNAVRNLPRLPPPRLRRAPITRALRCAPMSDNDWAAWNIRP